MKYGISIINFGPGLDARGLAAFAREAEEAGWDGFFIWDHMAMGWPIPFADVTVTLAAIALATERIRFGALMTPLPRRHPAKFAREAIELDHLSGGRLNVGGVIGVDEELGWLGKPTDPRVRGGMLDEALDIIAGLWGGEMFSYEGKHFQVRNLHFLPAPVQQPRIPVWVGGTWPIKKPFERAARWDGVFPIAPGGGPEDLLAPEQIREIVAFIRERRETDAPFDVVASGYTPGDDPARGAESVAAYADAGATWWMESVHGLPPVVQEGENALERMRARIVAGPPRG